MINQENMIKKDLFCRSSLWTQIHQTPITTQKCACIDNQSNETLKYRNCNKLFKSESTKNRYDSKYYERDRVPQMIAMLYYYIQRNILGC